MGRKRLAPKVDEEPKLGKRAKKEEALPVKAESKKPKKEAEKESKKAKEVKPVHHEVEQTPRRGTRL